MIIVIIISVSSCKKEFYIKLQIGMETALFTNLEYINVIVLTNFLWCAFFAMLIVIYISKSDHFIIIWWFKGYA